MLSKDELLKYPDYLLTKYQLEIYRQVMNYMQTNNFSKTDLALQMGVSNPYISQILNGNFNYTLKKLIEIGLTIGRVPKLSFIPIEQYKIESATPVSIHQNSFVNAVADSTNKKRSTNNESLKPLTLKTGQLYNLSQSDLKLVA